MAQDGAGILQSLTGSGSAPGSALVLQQLTAFGSAVGTALVLQSLTASAVQLGADAKGSNLVKLQVLTALGLNLTGTTGDGAAALQALVAAASIRDVASASLQRLTATGTNLTGTNGVGLLTMAVPTATGVALSPGLAAGTLQFQQFAVSAFGIGPGTAAAKLSLRKLQVQTVALGGTAGVGLASAAKLFAAAIGAPLGVATGTALLYTPYASAWNDVTLPNTFTSWAMNTRNLNVTGYTNFKFNSYAKFNDQTFAAGPDGIKQLGGKDDAGAPISAIVRTGNLDDGSGQLLRPLEVLAMLASPGPVRISLVKEDGSVFPYTAQYTGIPTMVQVRVTPGKGLRALHYRVEIANIGGGSFELGAITLKLKALERRLGDR